MIDEGYIKFDSRWQKTAPLEHVEIAELNRWRLPLHQAGLIGHYDELGVGFGNLSVRLPGTGRFIISGTQTGHIAETGAEHYALVEDFDIGENRVASRGASEASSESLTHAALYMLDSQVCAVVHVHSDGLWNALKDKAPTTDAEVAYGTPGIALEFSRLWRETDFPQSGVAVMAGHESGLVSIGRDLEEATKRILAVNSKNHAGS